MNDVKSNVHGYFLIIFGVALALGSLQAWPWLPDIEKSRREETGLILACKTLEELAEGMKGARERNEVIGFRERLSQLLRK